MPDSNGRGWHGDAEGHRKAAVKANRSRIRSGMAAFSKGVLLLLAVPMTFLALCNGPGRWVRDQFIGTLANLWAAVGYFTRPEATLPPTIVSTLNWFKETAPRILGLGTTTPRKQVAATISTIGVALLATFLTGGLLAATVVIILGLMSVGFARMVPAVNSEWGKWRSALGLGGSGERKWRRE